MISAQRRVCQHESGSVAGSHFVSWRVIGCDSWCCFIYSRGISLSHELGSARLPGWVELGQPVARGDPRDMGLRGAGRTDSAGERPREPSGRCSESSSHPGPLRNVIEDAGPEEIGRASCRERVSSPV